MTTIGTAVLQVIPSLRGVSAEINKQLAAMPDVGTNAGKQIGANIAAGVGASAPGKKIGKELEQGVAQGAEGAAGQVKSRLSERLGSQVGSAVGKSIGAGIKLGITGGAAAATAAVAGIGITLKQGFDRLQSIDQASFKLKALGHSADETKQIMDNALASVKGTAFGLQDAATAAASAVAAGIKPGQDLTKYLGEIGDAAAVAGTNFEDMGSIFNKIQTQNKAYTDDLQQLSDRGLPIFTWLQQEYGVTGDKLTEMVQKGEVDSAHFQDAIAKNIGGAAQKMGQSFDGAVDNLEASVARLGANFITAALGGDPANALQGPTAAIGNLTDKFDGIGKWVNEHSGEIHGFFIDIKNVAVEAASAVKDIGTWLVENKGAAETLAAVFVGWKVASVLGEAAAAAKGIGSALGLIDGAAASAAGSGGLAALSKAILGAVGPLAAVPGFLGFANSQLKDAPPSAENARARGAEALANRGGALAGSGNDPAQRPTAPYVPTGATSSSLNGPNGPFGGGAAGYVPPTPGGYLIPGKKDLFGNGFGSGGAVSGPGTGISDSIVARLSNGEFVVNANATRKNLPLLEIINSGKLPGFAGGGLVKGDQELADIIKQRFGITNIGGYRPADKYGEHSTGRALDVMVGSDKAKGDAIKDFALANASAIDLKWAIWRQHLYYPGGGGYDMPDRGSPTQNHMDHVHIFSGTGIVNGLRGALAGGQSTSRGTAGTPAVGGPGAEDTSSGDQATTSADSSGGGGSGPLPTSISGLATWPIDAITANAQANSGPGHRDPVGYFGTAASAAIGGQISSALGVAGINGAPPFLQGLSEAIGQVKVTDHATGKSLFDGANPLGGLFGQGQSAAPLSARPTGTGTPLADGVHSGTGEAPGPTVVNNVSFHARDAEGALDQYRRLMDQRVAAKLSVY